MNPFWLALAAALAVFGLLAASLALRQHRHPEVETPEHSGGCAHPQQRIKCLQCPSRLPAGNTDG